MSVFLTFTHITVCLILISVILLQAGRSQGLTGASFGGGNVQSLLGTRAADFLTKATSIAAICFLVTSISLDLLEARKSRSLLEIERKAKSVDVDAIRQALEKVKAEDAAVDAALEDKEAMPVVEETADLIEETSQASQSLTDSIDEAIPQAEQTVDDAIADVRETAPQS